MVRGIPFETTLPDKVILRSEAMGIFDAMRNEAANVPEMSLDEINAEINQVRAARKAGR